MSRSRDHKRKVCKRDFPNPCEQKSPNNDTWAALNFQKLKLQADGQRERERELVGGKRWGKRSTKYFDSERLGPPNETLQRAAAAAMNRTKDANRQCGATSISRARELKSRRQKCKVTRSPRSSRFRRDRDIPPFEAPGNHVGWGDEPGTYYGLGYLYGMSGPCKYGYYWMYWMGQGWLQFRYSLQSALP